MESVWKSTLTEIDKTTSLIEVERKRIKEVLQSYQYDVQRDEVGLFDPKAHHQKLDEVRNEFEDLVNLQLNSIKSAFSTNPDQFFDSDFSLK